MQRYQRSILNKKSVVPTTPETLTKYGYVVKDSSNTSTDNTPFDPSQGWVPLPRSIRDHWVWNDAEKLKWFLDIYLECNHTSRKVNIGYRIIDCERGQSINSLQTWAKRWRSNKNTVSRFFRMLENDGIIKVENVQKTTRITVCNYDSYNNARDDKVTIKGRNRDVTGMKQGCDSATNNNEKNVKNDKNETITLPWESDFFKNVWAKWKEYKLKEHKFKYKSADSEKAAVSNLVTLSKNNEADATKIIEQSIANGWKGFFELKPPKNGNINIAGNTKPSKGGSIADLQALKHASSEETCPRAESPGTDGNDGRNEWIEAEIIGPP